MFLFEVFSSRLAFGLTPRVLDHLTLQIGNSLFFLNSFIRAFFYLEAKKNSEKEKITTKKIFWDYLKTSFLLDLLSFISVFSFLLEGLRFFQFLRLHYLPQGTKLLNNLIGFLIKKTVRRASSALTLQRVVTRSVSFAIYFTTGVQLLTCIWIFVSYFPSDQETAWFYSGNLTNKEIYLDSLFVVMT